MRRVSLSALAMLGCVLAFGSACGGAAADDRSADGSTTSSSPEVPSGEGLGGGRSSAPGVTTTNTAKTQASAAQPAWPTPENCVAYNPSNLTMQYAAGVYQVNDGTKTVARVAGGPGENTGDKLLALAQRYRRHCTIGQSNTREDKHLYVFDYWRDPSGRTPTIADQADDCSGYDKHNIVVNDMGSGNGWRVKDDDHVLHMFNTEADARNGRLVLARYSRICFIGGNDDEPGQVSYSL